MFAASGGILTEAMNGSTKPVIDFANKVYRGSRSTIFRCGVRLQGRQLAETSQLFQLAPLLLAELAPYEWSDEPGQPTSDTNTSVDAKLGACVAWHQCIASGNVDSSAVYVKLHQGIRDVRRDPATQLHAPFCIPHNLAELAAHDTLDRSGYL
ncbi:MAG TPA: hypothetical protein VFN67_24195, partial [Polyangiales bacterium]|nr:hypothetical protein [Polyangiales bacterium]